jgi:hypothetical protein
VKRQFFAKKVWVVCNAPDACFKLIDILRSRPLTKLFDRVSFNANNVTQHAIG